jgi:metallo-beta-lactamase class B
VVYAIPTSEGIVLLDAGYADIVETVLVSGLQELGLDPSDVRYILLGHGHADHYGGAAYFQSQYGTRVGITDADWTVMEERAQNARPGDAPAPTRDLIIRDGEAIEIGELTITPIAIPGHTPGALAYIFPVTDNGVPHLAGLFAGTVLIAERVSTPNLQQYIDSIGNYAGIAERMGVDVEIQNHPLFDNTPERIASLATRSADDAHPFVMGTSNYVRFWRIISECMQADILRRDLPATP